MWIRALIGILLLLMDLMVLALIGTQWATSKNFNWNILGIAVLLNLLGAYLWGLAKTD